MGDHYSQQLMTRLAQACTDSGADSVEQTIEDAVLSPVILTGRGGSGTRMLSSLASTSNVFIGNQLNASGDSVEWAELLYEMSIQKLNIPEPALENQSVDWNNKLLVQAKHILNKGNWDNTQLWGWKLPESMLVIPELTGIFNTSKLIHLVRHPVTSSIRRTHKTSRKSNAIGMAVLRAAYEDADRDPKRIDEDDDYLRNALTWKFQVGQVSRFARQYLPANRYWEVRYEDICAYPDEIKNTLLKFLNVGASSVVQTDYPVQIDRNRENTASFADERAEEVWDLCASIASELGYQPTGVNYGQA